MDYEKINLTLNHVESYQELVTRIAVKVQTHRVVSKEEIDISHYKPLSEKLMTRVMSDEAFEKKA